MPCGCQANRPNHSRPANNPFANRNNTPANRVNPAPAPVVAPTVAAPTQMIGRRGGQVVTASPSPAIPSNQTLAAAQAQANQSRAPATSAPAQFVSRSHYPVQLATPAGVSVPSQSVVRQSPQMMAATAAAAYRVASPAAGPAPGFTQTKK